MRKEPTRKRPYFTMESAMTAILRDASGKMHHGILFDPPLAWAKNQPNNFRDEDCMHTLGVEYKYEWNDVKCSDCHQYTCKKGKM